MSFSTPIKTEYNPGTRGVQLRPHVDRDYSRGPHGRDEFQSISAQRECLKSSFEELRLADYEYGEGVSSSPPASSSTTRQILPSSNDKKKNNHLDLLHGPGIEVHVSTTTLPHDLTRPVTCSFWTLPRALISHHSPFLEAACSRDFKERRENRIELPEDDPTVFGLFVEWMYYGDYAIAPLSSFPAGSTKSTNVNAKCWVLGDKLLCTDFKNHAMSRLYAQHTAVAFNRAVTTSDVQYACNNSANPSKLRELYVALVAMHFDSPDRTGGTAEEWDSLVVEHSDLRSSLLQSFRSNAKDRTFLKSKEHYLERSPISARIGPDQ